MEGLVKEHERARAVQAGVELLFIKVQYWTERAYFYRLLWGSSWLCLRSRHMESVSLSLEPLGVWKTPATNKEHRREHPSAPGLWSVCCCITECRSSALLDRLSGTQRHPPSLAAGVMHPLWSLATSLGVRLRRSDILYSLANHWRFSRLWGGIGGTSTTPGLLTPTSATLHHLHPSSPLICKSLLWLRDFLGSLQSAAAGFSTSGKYANEHIPNCAAWNAIVCSKCWIWSFPFLQYWLFIYNLLWKLGARSETLNPRLDNSSLWKDAIKALDAVTLHILQNYSPLTKGAGWQQQKRHLYLCLCMAFSVSLNFWIRRQMTNFKLDVFDKKK